jgi:hypothetical protein
VIAKRRSIFLWSNNSNQGMKYSTGNVQGREQLAIKWLTKFECQLWRDTDYSKFVLPSNIEFNEVSAGNRPFGVDRLTAPVNGAVL